MSVSEFLDSNLVSDACKIQYIDIAREVFPDLPDEALGYILWNYTGYPGFFHARTVDGIIEECRQSLIEWRDMPDHLRSTYDEWLIGATRKQIAGSLKVSYSTASRRVRELEKYIERP